MNALLSIWVHVQSGRMYRMQERRHFLFHLAACRCEEERQQPEKTKTKEKDRGHGSSSAFRLSEATTTADADLQLRAFSRSTMRLTPQVRQHCGLATLPDHDLYISAVADFARTHISSLSKKNGEKPVSFGESKWTDEETPPPPREALQAGVIVANCCAKKKNIKECTRLFRLRTTGKYLQPTRFGYLITSPPCNYRIRWVASPPCSKPCSGLSPPAGLHSSQHRKAMSVQKHHHVEE